MKSGKYDDEESPLRVPTSSCQYGRFADADLAERSAQGDLAAFEEICQRYYYRLYVYLCRMIKSDSDAEELAWKALDKLRKALVDGQYRSQDAFKTWVYTITTNLAKDWLRSQKRQVRTILDSPKNLEGRREPSALDRASARSHQDRVSIHHANETLELAMKACLRRLPTRQARVLLLAFWEEMEPAEIAKILNCTRNNVYQLKHAGENALRQCLRENSPEVVPSDGVEAHPKRRQEQDSYVMAAGSTQQSETSK